MGCDRNGARQRAVEKAKDYFRVIYEYSITYRDQPSALAVGSCWDRSSAFAGIDHRLLPSALAGIGRRLLLGSTASCNVSSANGNYIRRFDAAERHTFSVFLIAI
jgi:hypothetical protein